ncbi:MAG: hypothetical protein WDN48_03175 [Pseudolabrys sp.]
MPWSVKGIRPEARETAREAARRSGMSLGEWLNTVIIQQAAEDGVAAHDDDEEDGDDGELSTVHQRLDDLTRRIEQFGRTGPAAYAPKRNRNEDSQIAELIGRLDRRLDQFVNVAPAMAAVAPQARAQPAQSAAPNVRMPPALDLAVAEIAARQRALNGQPAVNEPTQQRAPAVAAAPVAAPVIMPVPTQDLSGLEDQLRKITNQIETLRKPGVEEAINALRSELGDIGRALTDAMPRHAIDTIEKQIQGLTHRIAENRQAGVDNSALSGVEHGLAEVRDALRGLTPAENLVGFNDAIANLAHKIDLIVAQKDPATLQQLEHSITTLRDMAAHVADADTVHGLATQVHMLAEKVEHLAMSAHGSEALDRLEHRIGALADALAERANNGATVPPMLDALVHSLSDKIELIQQSRGDNLAVGHLEDRIVQLVERLDASDSRLGHLEAIERGLADLLVHIEDMRRNKDAGTLRADNDPGVVELKHDIARTQDALEAVNGTLGHVVDRLVSIEKDIRGEGRARPAPAPAEFTEPKQPMGKIAVRMVSDAPTLAPPPPPPPPAPMPPPAAVAPPAPPPPKAQPAAAPAPKRLPQVTHLPINPDLPPDEPLEPGSGAPRLRAARLAASEAALGSAAAAAPAGKSGFIAAARRAAQIALQTKPERKAPIVEPVEMDEAEPSSLRAKMMKRVKSLFIAASIIAVVVGSAQIAGNYFEVGKSGKPNAETAKAPNLDIDTDGDTADIDSAAPDSVPASPLASPLATPRLTDTAPLSGGVPMPKRPADFNAPTQSLPSLLNPPVLTPQPAAPKTDVTGSISRQAIPRPPARLSAPETELPVTIGGPRLRSAATAGDGAAAYEIAVRFAEGRGVAANPEEAAQWFERAGNKGVAPAQFRYASMLEKGQGVKKDLVQARRLYLAAAGKGNGKAMHNLAVLYAEGIEGKPDYGTAAQWFRKASQHGIADSQYNLGVLCARGLGTAKSDAESYKWFALAAAQGDREAAKKRDEVASHMDADELATAEATVKNFAVERQPEEAVAVPEPAGGWDGGASALPARGKPRAAAASAAEPMSLGSFQVGKQ